MKRVRTIRVGVAADFTILNLSARLSNLGNVQATKWASNSVSGGRGILNLAGFSNLTCDQTETYVFWP